MMSILVNCIHICSYNMHYVYIINTVFHTDVHVMYWWLLYVFVVFNLFDLFAIKRLYFSGYTGFQTTPQQVSSRHCARHHAGSYCRRWLQLSQTKLCRESCKQISPETTSSWTNHIRLWGMWKYIFIHSNAIIQLINRIFRVSLTLIVQNITILNFKPKCTGNME